MTTLASALSGHVRLRYSAARLAPAHQLARGQALNCCYECTFCVRLRRDRFPSVSSAHRSDSPALQGFLLLDQSRALRMSPGTRGAKCDRTAPREPFVLCRKGRRGRRRTRRSPRNTSRQIRICVARDRRRTTWAASSSAHARELACLIAMQHVRFPRVDGRRLMVCATRVPCDWHTAPCIRSFTWSGATGHDWAPILDPSHSRVLGTPGHDWLAAELPVGYRR
jgi:hypothetical protein